MKLMLDKHITYFAFNFNDVSYTANAQTIDCATSLNSLIYVYYMLFFSKTITRINKDTTDLRNLILN